MWYRTRIVVRAYTGLILMATVAGCTSMLPHLQMPDEIAQKMGQAVALTNFCAGQGMSDPQRVNEFIQAVGQIRSVSVYNNSLFESSARYLNEHLKTLSTEELSGQCDDANNNIGRIAAGFRQRYQEISHARGEAMSAIVGGMASYQPNYPSYNFIPAPSNQPTFGLPENRTQNYIVNTNRGNRHCQVLPSGYVNCM